MNIKLLGLIGVGVAAAGVACYAYLRKPVTTTPAEDATVAAETAPTGFDVLNTALRKYGRLVHPTDTLGATDYPDRLLKADVVEEDLKTPVDLKTSTGVVYYTDQFDRLIIVLTGPKPKVWFQRYSDNTDLFYTWNPTGESSNAAKLVTVVREFAESI